MNPIALNSYKNVANKIFTFQSRINVEADTQVEFADEIFLIMEGCLHEHQLTYTWNPFLDSIFD